MDRTFIPTYTCTRVNSDLLPVDASSGTSFFLLSIASTVLTLFSLFSRIMDTPFIKKARVVIGDDDDGGIRCDEYGASVPADQGEVRFDFFLSLAQDDDCSHHMGSRYFSESQASRSP